ncbi:MAG TPA: hypothetical protein VEI51_02905 [Methanomicrobiales archaeon]|nr:hypothetical protein [Methanomicrobiales archaeon]
MDRKTITGLLVLSMIAVLFVAGCTTQGPENGAEQATVQQPVVTASQPAGSVAPGETPAAGVQQATDDQGLVQDDGAAAVQQADSYGTSSDTNATPDSEDLGDILP